MIKQRKLLWLAVMSSFVLAALLLAACGTDIPTETAPAASITAEPEESAAAEPETVSDINEIFGGTAVSSNDAPPHNPDAIPAGSEVNASGVPVGFTENGNPYRGNPDASVVIEEFSDFQ